MLVPGKGDYVAHHNVSGVKTHDVDDISDSAIKSTKHLPRAEMVIDGNMTTSAAQSIRVPKSVDALAEIHNDLCNFIAPGSFEKRITQCCEQLDCINDMLQNMGEEEEVVEISPKVYFKVKEFLILLKELLVSMLGDLLAQAQMSVMSTELSMELVKDAADKIRDQGWASFASSLTSGVVGGVMVGVSVGLSFEGAGRLMDGTVNKSAATTPDMSKAAEGLIQSGHKYNAVGTAVNTANNLTTGLVHGGFETMKSGMSAQQKIYEQEGNVAYQLAQQNQDSKNRTIQGIAELIALINSIAQDLKQAADKAAVDC